MQNASHSDHKDTDVSQCVFLYAQLDSVLMQIVCNTLYINAASVCAVFSCELSKLLYQSSYLYR